jgi:hypothetical protein
MEYCGINLNAEYSQICILDEDGEVMDTSTLMPCTALLHYDAKT